MHWEHNVGNKNVFEMRHFLEMESAVWMRHAVGLGKYVRRGHLMEGGIQSIRGQKGGNFLT